MKIRAFLKEQPPEVLYSIAEFWGLQPPPNMASDQLADFLYPRVQTLQYFRAAYDKLSSDEQDIVLFVHLHGGVLSADEIAQRCFNGDAAARRKSLTDFTRKGFLFPESGNSRGALITFPPPFTSFLELPPHLKGYCGRLLAELPAEALHEIGKLVLGSKRSAAKRPFLAYDIRAKLLEPEFLRKHVESLGEPEQEMFGAMLKNKGFCLYRDLLDPNNTKRFDHVRAEQLNNLIATSGLVFSLVEGQNKYTNLLLVPRDLCHVTNSGYTPDLRTMKELDVLSIHQDDFLPTFILDNANAFLRDLTLFAAHIHSLDTKRLTNGGIGRNDLKRALNVLSSRKTPKYASFLASFLISNKYLIDVAGSWKTSEAFVRWLEGGSRCLFDVYNWWLLSTEWNESAPEGNPKQCVTGRLVNTIRLRTSVIDGIKGLPRDRWVMSEAFAENLLPQVESSFSETSSRTNNASALETTLKKLIGVIIAEPLNWLGIVALGLRDAAHFEALFDFPANATPTSPERSRKTAARHADCVFQSTTLGRSALRVSDANGAASAIDERQLDDVISFGGDEVIVQPNLAIMAPPDLALDKLFFLAQFSKIRNVDVVTTVEVSRESLAAAMDNGVSGREILAFLQKSSKMELPQMIHHLIDECSKKHGQVSIGTSAGYITVDSPLRIEEIRANTKISPQIKDVIGDQVILLAPDSDMQKIARELRHIGLMPQLESETIHATSENKYHLTVTPEELCDILAGMRLIGVIEEQLKADITRGKANELMQKLKPDSPAFFSYSRHLETTAHSFAERFKSALSRIVDEVQDKYKMQVSRLVSKGIRSRAPSKYSFRGPNPAVERKDIVELLSYAREYELETEILYVRQNDQEARLLITPKSFEGERLYAYCMATDSDSMYSLQRILRARLV